MLAVMLFNALLGIDPVAAQLPAPRLLSPMQVVKQAPDLLERDPIVVKFRVGTVDTMKVTLPDETSFIQYRLHPNTEFDPALRATFHVGLTSEVEKTLKRVGIQDLEAHFKNKVVQVKGRLSRTGLHLVGSESIWFYHIEICDLDQLQAVVAAP